MKTREQVRYALEQTRERFGVLLRGELRAEAGPDADLEREIEILLELCG